nr:lipopolysaccharide biosynthesis protein [uncultured Carboxylicivirga sp.]
MGSVKQKTINSIIWNGIERFSTLFIQLVSTLIIARILTPEDFGIIGMLAIFTALGNVIIDSGFSQGLIRKSRITNDDLISVFAFNIILSIVLYLIFYFCAPLIAKFYNTPQLTLIARVSFLSFPINALSIIQQTVLQKELNFKKISKITISASILSGILGVLFAILLRNVWALILQILFFNTFKSILFWFFSTWRLKGKFSLSSIYDLGRFSFNLLLSGLVGVIFDNMYTLMIGKFYDSKSLGLYTQSKKIAELPALSISNVIQKVTYPSLSLFQTDLSKLKYNYRRIIQLAVYIISPICGFLIITAPDLFKMILGEKWNGAIFFFQMLCLIGVLYPVSSISINILKVVGKSSKLIQLEVIKKVVMALILIYTIRINLEAVVYGNIVYSLFAVLLNLYFCGKEIQLKIWEQLKDILPSYFLTIVISLIVYYLNQLIDFSNNILMILLMGLIYCLIWIGFSFIFKFDQYNELLKVFGFTKKSI